MELIILTIILVIGFVFNCLLTLPAFAIGHMINDDLERYGELSNYTIFAVMVEIVLSLCLIGLGITAIAFAVCICYVVSSVV